MITKTSLQHQAERLFLFVKNKVVVIVIDHKLYTQRLKFCIYYFCIHRYILNKYLIYCENDLRCVFTKSFFDQNAIQREQFKLHIECRLL